jgi:hypothetical protein
MEKFFILMLALSPPLLSLLRPEADQGYTERGNQTCGFQEQGEHVDSITGGTSGFQEQGEHVDSKNRGNM